MGKRSERKAKAEKTRLVYKLTMLKLFSNTMDSIEKEHSYGNFRLSREQAFRHTKGLWPVITEALCKKDPENAHFIRSAASFVLDELI